MQAVFANHDDDPTPWRATPRCAARWPAAASPCTPRKDHVVFERGEVLTASGTPYTVFTPYKHAWLAKLDAFYLKAYPVERHAGGAWPPADRRGGGAVPSLAALGFEPHQPGRA